MNNVKSITSHFMRILELKDQISTIGNNVNNI